MSEPLFVGRVRFEAQTANIVQCTVCKKMMQRASAAAHAREKHRGMSEGVLAGQLGLPFTRTPDVPR